MLREPFCDVEFPILIYKNFTWAHLIKIEWLIADVTPGASSDRAERATQEMIVDVSLANSGRFCD